MASATSSEMSSETSQPQRERLWKEPEEGHKEAHQIFENGIKIFSSLGVYCRVCYPVSRDLGVFSKPRAKNGDEVVVFKWLVRLADLVAAVDAGCHFCSFMARRFFGGKVIWSVFSGEATTQDIACCGRSPKAEKTEKVVKALENLQRFTEKYPGAEFILVVEPIDYSKPDGVFGRIRITGFESNLTPEAADEILGNRYNLILEIYAAKGVLDALVHSIRTMLAIANPATKDNPAAPYIKVRPINIHPSSEASVEQAKAWIQECLQNHSSCPGLSGSILPSRVVEISDDENLRLRAGIEPGSYTALSYCWGGPQEFATTMATIDEKMKGFKLSDLPATLQDAVDLTRRLGKHYTWIDSLCVIQDSETDKAKEIPRMSQYYKNSYVTICAAGPSCNSGFLKVHDECEQHTGFGVAKDLLRLPYLCPDGVIGEVYFREEAPYVLSWEPISHRGWTLQERLLSPRVLIYGLRLMWQCHSAQRSDGGIQDWSFDVRASDHRRLQLDLRDADMSIETDKLAQMWYRAICEFTHRKLTVPDDKLPAIAGLAAEFSRFSGDEYLAGLWRGHLLRELMWSTYPELRLIKPLRWRAPSWSWASIDNEIKFQRLPPKDAIALANIVHCSVTTRYPDTPFGEVSEAILEINAPLLRLSRDYIKNLLDAEYRIPTLNLRDPGWTRDFINMLDENRPQNPGGRPQPWEPPENCAIIALFAEPTVLSLNDPEIRDEDSAIVSGLVLVETEDNKFERIACFTKMSTAGVTNFELHRKTVQVI